MRFKRHIKLEHGLQSIDIVPLINIVFLLILFFMLTSTFVMQPGIAVNLPRSVTSDVIQAQNIEIVVSREDVVYIDGKVVTAPELEKLLKQARNRQQSVLIKSDRRAALGKVVEIWDLCRTYGIAQVNIATNQE